MNYKINPLNRSA